MPCVLYSWVITRDGRPLYVADNYERVMTKLNRLLTDSGWPPGNSFSMTGIANRLPPAYDVVFSGGSRTDSKWQVWGTETDLEGGTNGDVRLL